MKTIYEVLLNKFISFLEENKLSDIATVLFRILASVFLALGLSNLPRTIQTLRLALLFHDFFIPKLIFSSILVWNYKYIFKCFRSVFASLPDLFPKEEREVENFLWMDIEEIVNYILEKKTFKREEFAKQFSIGRDTAEKLWKRLDEINLFIRGENNSRKLNAEFSPEDIYNIFYGKEIIENLSPVYKKIWEWNYEIVSPPSGFVRTKIQES